MNEEKVIEMSKKLSETMYENTQLSEQIEKYQKLVKELQQENRELMIEKRHILLELNSANETVRNQIIW